MYATYAFYTDTYKGTTLTENNFDHYELRAEAYLKSLTLGKSDKYTGNELKHCACAVADKLFHQDNDDEYKRSGISSEKVGEYSVSFVNNSSMENEEHKKSELLEIAKQYLSLTGLLYRGR